MRGVCVCARTSVSDIKPRASVSSHGNIDLQEVGTMPQGSVYQCDLTHQSWIRRECPSDYQRQGQGKDSGWIMVEGETMRRQEIKEAKDQ